MTRNWTEPLRTPLIYSSVASDNPDLVTIFSADPSNIIPLETSDIGLIEKVHIRPRNENQTLLKRQGKRSAAHEVKLILNISNRRWTIPQLLQSKD